MSLAGQGLLERLLDVLRECARTVAERLPEPTAAVTDSQSVKTTESGGDAVVDAPDQKAVFRGDCLR